MSSDTLAGVPELSRRRYGELAVGDVFGPFDEPLRQEASDALRSSDVGAAVPGTLAPPGVLPLLTLRVLRRALDGIIPGGVLVAQRFAVHAELPAAATLSVRVQVRDQQRGRAGLFTSFTFTLFDGPVLCAVVDWTILS